MQYDIKIQNVDLVLLKEQKKALLELQYRTDLNHNPIIRTKEYEALEGIILLIDHIQDQAVEQHNLDENEVFDLNKEN